MNKGTQPLKLLFLTSRFPFPLEKGDKLRAYYLIKHLSHHFEIVLFAVNHGRIPAEYIQNLQPFCSKVIVKKVTLFQSAVAMIRNIFRKNIPFQSAYFYSEKAQAAFDRLITTEQPDYVFCHLIRMTEYLKNYPEYNSMLDYMDAFSLGMKRYADELSFPVKLLAKTEAKRLATYESEVFDRFNHKIIISEQDRDAIQHNEHRRIHIIPNGIDFSEFLPKIKPIQQDLIYVGNMSYPPNITSARFVAKEIMPLLMNKHPAVTFTIAGANPTHEIRSLKSKNIRVTGWVEDMSEVIASSRIMVAPMLISIGLQNKILQAMAMKIPCIISTLANNAIGATDNETVMIADSPQQFAEKISMLLDNEHLRLRIAENAYQFVRSTFRWEEQAGKIQELFTHPEA